MGDEKKERKVTTHVRFYMCKLTSTQPRYRGTLDSHHVSLIEQINTSDLEILIKGDTSEGKNLGTLSIIQDFDSILNFKRHIKYSIIPVSLVGFFSNASAAFPCQCVESQTC